jgi:hypothetical protein
VGFPDQAGDIPVEQIDATRLGAGRLWEGEVGTDSHHPRDIDGVCGFVEKAESKSSVAVRCERVMELYFLAVPLPTYPVRRSG